MYSNEVFRDAADLLVDELASFLKDNNLPQKSADELIIDLLHEQQADEESDVEYSRNYGAMIEYLEHYVARWDAVANDDQLITHEHGVVIVGGEVSDEQQEAMHDKHESSNLKTDVPNIRLSIGGAEFFLTWDEAMAIGKALQIESRICEHG